MDQVRAQTEQLRIEAQVSRKKISEVSKEWIFFLVVSIAINFYEFNDSLNDIELFYFDVNRVFFWQ